MLMDKCDVLSVQEHHLYPDMHQYIKTISTGVEGFVRSDRSLSLNDSPRIRKGGVAILWKANIGYAVCPLYSLGNDRVMAIKIQTTGNEPLFVIIVYLPSSNYPLSEYDDALSVLSNVHAYCSDRGRVLVLGDMNGQLGQIGGARCPLGQSVRGGRLHNFMEEHNLVSLVSHTMCTGPVVTYTGYDDQHGTQIDHICVDKSDICNIIYCRVGSDSAINTSDHHDITVVLRIDLKRFHHSSGQFLNGKRVTLMGIDAWLVNTYLKET